jgi:hypothetical protein
MTRWWWVFRPLTREIKDSQSPVHRFLGELIGPTAVRDVQRRYRDGAGSLLVPGNDAYAGSVGTATDWLLRFLLHPHPDVRLAMAGARIAGSSMERALAALVVSLGAPTMSGEAAAFVGPVAGSDVDGELLSRGCWALALLTEIYRGGPIALEHSPLKGYLRPGISAEDLLTLTPASALEQLAQIRDVLETTLIPHLAGRAGPWAIGPRFAGSKLMKADADLIAAGLLLELKTTLGRTRADGTRRASLEKIDLYQLIGYALLDFDDAHHISEVGIFNARYGYLTTWPLQNLLTELAGRNIDLAATRQDFQRLLSSRG